MLRNARPQFALTLTLIALLLCALTGCERRPRAPLSLPPTTVQTEAGGIQIDPKEGAIANESVFTVSFPSAMVSSAVLDRELVDVPVRINPPLNSKIRWTSPTEAQITITEPAAPGQIYRFQLRPGLTDAAGQPVSADNWGAEFTADTFTVEMIGSMPRTLGLATQIPLLFSYPVDPAQAARTIFFRESLTGQRFPVDVIITSMKTTGPLKNIQVTPRSLLPPDRNFDLVIDGTLAAGSDRPLKLWAMPAGRTDGLKVDWVAALNQPLSQPMIRIHCNDHVRVESVTSDTIRVTPPVANFALEADDENISIKGDFDLHQKYRVQVMPGIVGDRGYSLAKVGIWSAQFHAKRPSVIFPGARIAERSKLGLNFSFYQVNCGPVRWQLASVPLEKLFFVEDRLREFEGNEIDPLSKQFVIDPATRLPRLQPTEPLVAAQSLPVIASGDFPAVTGQDEVLRQIQWKPPEGVVPGGVYLLEATGRDAAGRLVGNRTLVTFGDEAIVQKRGAANWYARVMRMGDGAGVPGIPVQVVTRKNLPLAEAVTDANGLATFPSAPLTSDSADHKPYLFVARAANGPVVQFTSGSAFPSGYVRTGPIRPSLRSLVVTDRPLYRPGDTVHLKGFVRAVDANGKMLQATDRTVHWKIASTSSEADTLAEGDAPLSPAGGWEAEWKTTPAIGTEFYRVAVKTDDEEAIQYSAFQIQEYRTPLFFVEATNEDSIGDRALLRVSSRYFHGAANANARVRWKATWWPVTFFEGHDDLAFFDRALKDNPPDTPERVVEGETQLGPDGTATLEARVPTPDLATQPRVAVLWSVQVTSVEGETQSAGSQEDVQFTPQIVGLSAKESAPPRRGVDVHVASILVDNKPGSGVKCDLTLYHVDTETVREKLGAHVIRYRNSNIPTEVAHAEVTTPANFFQAVKDTGQYVAVVKPKTGAPPSSVEVTVSGEEAAQLPLEDSTKLTIHPEKDKYAVGETAVLSVQSPRGGVAWVSIETDTILDTIVVPLAGNAGRIELPLKDSYAPNATVSVYLLKPGGDNLLPTEQFGFTDLKISRPDVALAVQPVLDKENVEPGQTVSGYVSVNCESKPVTGAEVTLFAVDDAVLRLGDWRLPEILDTFYPSRSFGIETYAALGDLVASIDPKSLTEKGYIIGDGGDETHPNILVRNHFLALAYWNGLALSNASGRVPFSFKAPDNLTAYRLVALAQTKADQFGANSALVTVSKPLQVEPSLPLFVRNGDKIELRAVVRQTAGTRLPVKVRCQTTGALKLDGEETATVQPGDSGAALVRFPASVDASGTEAHVKFVAIAEGKTNLADATELPIPVKPPTLIRHQTVAGIWPDGFVLADVLKKAGLSAQPPYLLLNITVSGASFLPELMAMPTVLDYPHGCFEQISDRILAYTLLAPLVDYLPQNEARATNLRKRVEDGLLLYSRSLLPNGFLPYWPDSKQVNPFATLMAAWATREAVAHDLPVPDKLSSTLDDTIGKIVQGKSGQDDNPFNRCFALFISAQGSTPDDNAAIAEDLYLKRKDYTDETRALLALALNAANRMPDAQHQLVRELGDVAKDRAFDPAFFSSAPRAEALKILAIARIEKPAGAHLAELQKEASSLLGQSLSTQESVWSLLAFRALHDAESTAKVDPRAFNPAPPLISKNGVSVGWPDASALPQVKGPALPPGATGAYAVELAYRDPEPEKREDHGFRLERVVKNLTDATRLGTPEAPFKIGDELRIVYHIVTPTRHDYVALEDYLPAGIQALNTHLPQPEQSYSDQSDGGSANLWLSHDEFRDDRLMLYFDRVPQGASTYAVLARVTSAGEFRWPGAEISPMYDQRSWGTAPSLLCTARGD